ncbi:MAG: acyl-CoA carboxylase subunit beta [Bacteroidales bacterium]|nr:acyl-CoA carboxylase subunit beta [Bacteroidales bacterium]
MDVKGRNFTKFLDREKVFEKQNNQEIVDKQHSRGKLTARERIHILFDEGTFEEIDAFVAPVGEDTGFGKMKRAYGDGVIIGHGRISNRLTFAYAQDFNVMGGSLGEIHATKISKIQDMSLKMGAPIIGLIDSGGARIQEGIASLAGYASIFYRNVQASGVIPQISVIMGPAAGGAVYSPSITDFVFMTNKTSYMFVTGPNVVKEVLNEDVTLEDLGGAGVHSRKTGIANLMYEDEENTLFGVKKLLSYLPSNNLDNPPFIEGPTDDIDNSRLKLRDIVPDDANKPYDVKDVINLICDKGSFFEISEQFAQNIVVGFARLEGKTIGILANQPKVLAGTLDINSSMKGARFVRFCDSFNIPILTLEDVPGFLPGVDQEHNGIIRHGAKLLYAYADATVPRITVILRKSYGGAYCVMNSKNLGGDFNFAWPTAEIAVMGPEGAVAILYKRELAESKDPMKLKKELALKYRNEIANPYVADEKGYIDEVIDPANTRKKLISAFEALENKHVNVPSRKHGNIPL